MKWGDYEARRSGIDGRLSIWAYLPVGPLERQFREGYQGGFLGRGSEEPSRESCSLALVGSHGEASANYLDRCKIGKKVALYFKKDRKKWKLDGEGDFYLSGTLRR